MSATQPTNDRTPIDSAQRLRGQVALVTGANSGIVAATARALAPAGARYQR